MPSPELITCFVEGNTANFSLMGPCVENKGFSLDDWEKHFGSHLIAGDSCRWKRGLCNDLASVSYWVCGVAPHDVVKDGAGDVAGAVPGRWGQHSAFYLSSSLPYVPRAH